MTVCLVTIGMAGSGKSSCIQRINAYQSIKKYIVNLDPAIRQTVYNANIDIRDTVDYKKVMESYNLGNI